MKRPIDELADILVDVLTRTEASEQAAAKRGKRSTLEHPFAASTRLVAVERAHRHRGLVQVEGTKAYHLRVSEGALERALRLLDRLLPAFESAGFELDPPALSKGGVTLQLRITERLLEPEESTTKTSLRGGELKKLRMLQKSTAPMRGTGVFVLGMGVGKPDRLLVDDKRRGPLEKRIDEVVEKAQQLVEAGMHAGREAAAKAKDRQAAEQQRDAAVRAEGERVAAAKRDETWVRAYLAARREARECREAAAEIRALCERYNVDVLPDGDIERDIQKLLTQADAVDPMRTLEAVLRENAARWSPKHCDRLTPKRCASRR